MRIDLIFRGVLHFHLNVCCSLTVSDIYLDVQMMFGFIISCFSNNQKWIMGEAEGIVVLFNSYSVPFLQNDPLSTSLSLGE